MYQHRMFNHEPTDLLKLKDYATFCVIFLPAFRKSCSYFVQVPFNRFQDSIVYFFYFKIALINLQ